MVEKKHDMESDWQDPDDGPELTDDMMQHGQFSIGDKIIRPATGVLTADGMKPIEGERQLITLALPRAIVDYFRAGDGEAWQDRLEAVLQRHIAANDRSEAGSNRTAN